MSLSSSLPRQLISIVMLAMLLSKSAGSGLTSIVSRKNDAAWVHRFWIAC